MMTMGGQLGRMLERSGNPGPEGVSPMGVGSSWLRTVVAAGASPWNAEPMSLSSVKIHPLARAATKRVWGAAMM
jgi:hypothetical protein